MPLCLWLAWSAFSTAKRVSVQINAAAGTVLPLQAQITSLTEETIAARDALAIRRSERTENRAQIAALETRIVGVETQPTKLTAAVTALDADPDSLIDRAVKTAFERLGITVSNVISDL